MTSVSSGCLLEPTTGFTYSSMTMALSLGFVCTFTASDNLSISVYCSKVPDDGTVVNSTALTGCGGGHVTCLAASFHVFPVMVFSNRLLASGSITSVMHSEVSPAFLLSQWRTFSSSSVPSFHSGHAVGALNHIQPSLLFGNLYWLSVSISYVLGALNVSQNLILKAQAMPFGVTFQYHSQKSFIVICLYFIWYKITYYFLYMLKMAWGVCVYMWTGCLCSSAWDVTKHGDQSPSPMGISWVSDSVGIDSKEIYAYRRCSLLM